MRMKFIPITEGIGEDILPKNVDFLLLMVTKVTDKRCGSVHKKDSS
jgi:hypothetical protein